ncbi:hypothetical protein PFICI_10528 [Pestalotiopsis fici W106-1]|uniref:Uncharacterized protein n=1 Tax=Pestalotiopsis fici (strain W106-1 / CGMCC3.15140) TaxID=1229662 RepID=W3X003_PESFW|nr:uncharacterized protein PFICI_10528 [Pestalotiopsis fici W106-1]ETS78466.1 hypothetical protein PFICI_10528 [Pestalotiopsis fici W106-1]
MGITSSVSALPFPSPPPPAAGYPQPRACRLALGQLLGAHCAKGCRGEDSRAHQVGNLDFEARVPVPFSIFPSSYKDDKTAEVETTTQTHQEVQINLPDKKAGREGQYSSSQASVNLPPRREQRYSEEEVHITREEERYRRPGVHREYYEEHRPASSFGETYVEVDHQHRPSYTAIDQIEREYRSRYQPTYQEEVRVTGSTVDAPSHHTRPVYDEQIRVETTVDASKPGPSYHKETKIVEETVEYPRSVHSGAQKSRMGYYDEQGHYHSFRHGLHKMADKVFHHDHDRVEVREVRERSRPISQPAPVPNTVTIPCHHIRMGDILMLQGRPCQVIRISTSAATGQHRYLGVDLFTKQLHEESSFVSNPAPSVVVQTMLGPIFKQYRVLDIQDGTVVAMTETGDVKTGVPVTDQSGLWSRLSKAFESGRGSVRVLVLNDGGRELVVDVKTIHASNL